MTGRLESLVYTDCLPGDSLSGSAGLGFQAASPGAGPEARELTRNHLLYEPPAEWMRDRRPVAEYPASLAHIHANGWYATAAGVYLGKEAKGNRQGNHLTHAVATRDARVYDLIRPAQLAGADFWRTGPVPGGEAPVVGPEWAPGDLDTDTVADLVRERPGGRDLLTGLLAALTADERRIVLVGPDPREILAWIAAATLLLPQEKALGVGFKVYTTRPSHGAHRIVGVHPDWLPRDLEGMHVFDLRDETHDAGPADEVAATWADLLRAEDALDVIDAVELAAQSGLDPAAGQALAVAAFFGITPPSLHATALVDWLRECDEDRYRAYGDAVTTALLALRDRPRPLLASLDGLATAGRLGEHAAEIRLALLAEECRDAIGGAVEDPEPLPPLPSGIWLPEHRDRAETELAEAFTEIGVQRYRLLLAVADRFGLRPDLVGELAAPTDVFLDWWANNPGVSPEPSSFHSGELLRDRLLDTLRDRCGDDADEKEACRIGERWDAVVFRWLPGPPDWEDPLVRVCLGARGRHASPEELGALVRLHIKGSDAVEAEYRLSVLARWRKPRFEDLRHLATILPHGTRLPSGLADTARDEAFRRPLTDDLVLVLAALLDRRLVTDPELRTFADADGRLAELRVPKDPDSVAEAGDFLLYVHAYDHRLLKRHGGTVVAVLLTRRMPLVVATVLEDLSAAHRDEFGAALTERLKGRGFGPYDVFCAFTALTKKLMTPKVGPRLDAALSRVLRAADGDLLARTRGIVDGMGPGWRANWDGFAAMRQGKPGVLDRFKRRG